MSPVLLRGYFKNYGLVAPIYGSTPDLPGEKRSVEIRAWIAYHPDIPKYVVLDHAPEAAISGHTVRTNETIGITDEDVEMACAILV